MVCHAAERSHAARHNRDGLSAGCAAPPHLDRRFPGSRNTDLSSCGAGARAASGAELQLFIGSNDSCLVSAGGLGAESEMSRNHPACVVGI